MAKKVVPVSPAVKTAFVNRLPRSLGLEIELSDWGGLDANSFKAKHCEWYSDHDGSVQPSGQEMVILPLKDDAFPAAVLELYEAFDKFKCQVNETCGLHVHVGAEDMNGWQVRRLLKLYEMMQDGIYQLCKPGRDKAKSRHGYLFAARLDRTCKQEIQKMWATTRAGEVRRALIRMIYGVDLNPDEARQVMAVPGGGVVNGREHVDELAQFIRGMKNKYAGGQGTRGFVSRYFGLNLHSWFLRGTVEWRMKEGTLDLDELMNWPLFCGWFVYNAVRMNDRLEVGAFEKKSIWQEGVQREWDVVTFAYETMPAQVAKWVERKIRG